MKKLLLVIAMVAAGFTANAQETSFGATAGFNSTSVSASAGSISVSTSVSGFYVGFFADFDLGDKFSLVPELQYINGSKDGESLNVIALPVMAKYDISEKFSLQAGPMFDLVVDEVGDEFNSFGFGLATGVGYDFSENIFANARYSFGLNDRLDDGTTTTKMGYFQIGLGYRF